MLKVDEDSVVATSPTINDLIWYGTTEEEALRSFAKALVEYVQDFDEDYALYSAAPNRRGHVPYVLRALAASGIEGLLAMLEVVDAQLARLEALL